MKNAFCFILKALLLVRYLNFYPYFLVNVGKRLDNKAKVNFQNYDVINWKINFNAHNVQCIRQSDNKISSVIVNNMRNIFL